MVRIVSDSACDMSPREAVQKGVRLVPLKTLIDGVEYLDGVTISSEEFYEKLYNCKKLPSTSQISPGEFEEVFQEYTAQGDQVVAVCLSGKLSGTVQSAFMAAESFPGKVWVVDSQNVTIAQRILVEYAVRLRDQGLDAPAIAAELEKAKTRACLIARVDTLEYLMRGGRLSRTAAVAGTVLNIKPVVGIEGGELKVLGKARGSKQSNNMLTELVDKKGGIDFDMPYMLAYSGLDDALLKGYIENSRALWEGHTSELPVSTIGSTIGTHAGPGAIAVAFFAKGESGIH